MDLLLLHPFSKFAYAIYYRIVALYVNTLKPIPETKSEITEPMGADELLANLRIPVISSSNINEIKAGVLTPANLFPKRKVT